jgi:excisionase family DNA binding protein
MDSIPGVLTTDEVADLLRVSTSRVRQLAMSGSLPPLVRGMRPLRFREAEVIEYELANRRDRERIARLAEAWRLAS